MGYAGVFGTKGCVAGQRINHVMKLSDCRATRPELQLFGVWVVPGSQSFGKTSGKWVLLGLYQGYMRIILGLY